MWVAHDCGKALNRLTVEGQVQGSVWMGMGQAMSEETGYHDGLLITGNMLDYRVPTIQDSPPIEVGIVESNDPHGPFGAKEAGEGSLAAFLPALTNAIADATGVCASTICRSRPTACSRRSRSGGAARPSPRQRPGRLMDALPQFDLLRPRTLDEVVKARAAHPGSQLLGGGTDLVVNIRRGIVAPPTLIDVNDVAELRTIKADAHALEIGAAVTLSELAAHAEVIRHYPVVAQAAAFIAGPTHRNMGTVGGNLCLDTRCLFYNQSEWWRAANNHCLKTTGDICHVAPKSRGVCFATFSGDLAPALLTLGRRGRSRRARRANARLPLRASLYRLLRARTSRSPRRWATANIISRLRPGELVTAVRAEQHARPALGLRQDPHPPLDRISGDRRRGGAAPRGRHARRSARRLHRHQSAPGAARGHGRALRRRTRRARVQGARRPGRDQIMSMKTTFTPGHYRRRVAGVLARRLVDEAVRGIAARSRARSPAG